MKDTPRENRKRVGEWGRGRQEGGHALFGGVHHYRGKDRSLMGEKVQQRKLTMLPPIGKKKKRSHILNKRQYKGGEEDRKKHWFQNKQEIINTKEVRDSILLSWTPYWLTVVIHFSKVGESKNENQRGYLSLLWLLVTQLLLKEHYKKTNVLKCEKY